MESWLFPCNPFWNWVKWTLHHWMCLHECVHHWMWPHVHGACGLLSGLLILRLQVCSSCAIIYMIPITVLGSPHAHVKQFPVISNMKQGLPQTNLLWLWQCACLPLGLWCKWSLAKPQWNCENVYGLPRLEKQQQDWKTKEVSSPLSPNTAPPKEVYVHITETLIATAKNYTYVLTLVLPDH